MVTPNQSVEAPSLKADGGIQSRLSGGIASAVDDLVTFALPNPRPIIRSPVFHRSVRLRLLNFCMDKTALMY